MRGRPRNGRLGIQREPRMLTRVPVRDFARRAVGPRARPARRCRDLAESARFSGAFGAPNELSAARGARPLFGPGRVARALLRAFDESGIIGPVVKHFAYRLTGSDPIGALRRLARRWIDGRRSRGDRAQPAFCADGTVDDELSQLALPKAFGPHRYHGVRGRADAGPVQPT